MRLVVDGAVMNVHSQGEGSPLLLLHGFTGSIATWQPHLARFAEHFRTIALDLWGHGGSDAPLVVERYRMGRCIEDLLAVLDALDIERASVLGYSMGARVALRLALSAPERVTALALESASPGLTDAAEREARITADAALAAVIEREGIEAFVDYWERLPLFRSQAALSDATRARLRTQRLANSPLGLANSLRGLGTGQQRAVWDCLPSIRARTLLIVGGLDQKYCELGQLMAQMIQAARLSVVPNAGHAVHLEQPKAFENIVLEFLIGKEIKP